jgi:hypothetical protein
MRSIAFAVACAGLLAPRLASADDDLAVPPPAPAAIAGGEPAETCAFPTVVAYDDGCTGNLIHPRAAVFAAHCGESPAIVFGESRRGSFEVRTEQCWVNPDYNHRPGADWGICTLVEEVNLPVTPLAYGCELDVLEPGTPVVQVGFGRTSDSSGGSTKNWVVTQINAVGETELFIGGGGKGACPGDSGGPAFIELDDGSFRQIGIISTYRGICGSENTYARTDVALPWFESVTGMDLTPCHDSATGTWEPGPECVGFFAGGSEGSGTWSDGGPCLGTPASGPSDSCGPPFGHNDEDPPTVAITSPADRDSFDEAPVSLDVAVDASDGDGTGVAKVWLEIDGAEQPLIVEEEPYVFSGVTFPEGEYTIVAIAEDVVQLQTRSEEVTIYVGVDPPPEEETESGEASGSDDDGGVPDDDGLDDVPGWDEDDRGSSGCGCALPDGPDGRLGAMLGYLCLLASCRRRRA